MWATKAAREANARALATRTSSGRLGSRPALDANPLGKGIEIVYH